MFNIHSIQLNIEFQSDQKQHHMLPCLVVIGSFIKRFDYLRVGVRPDEI
jgi:hypothetical protein